MDMNHSFNTREEFIEFQVQALRRACDHEAERAFDVITMFRTYLKNVIVNHPRRNLDVEEDLALIGNDCQLASLTYCEEAIALAKEIALDMSKLPLEEQERLVKRVDELLETKHNLDEKYRDYVPKLMEYIKNVCG